MDVYDLLTHLRATRSDRQVTRDTGCARSTVSRYRQWAQEQGLLDGDPPPPDVVQHLIHQTLPKLEPPQNTSSVEPYAETVKKLRKKKVEVRAIFLRLRERGFTGSYSAVYRFVRKLEPRDPEATVRVETRPGEEAQIDFGYAGKMQDPETGALRKAWAFVMTLSWSRHPYVEFVFDQKVETWLGLHVRAFAYFGGVPRRITCDNLKAAIVKAAWNEPVVHSLYAECAQHYGFLIAPCRPRTPQHKGKVESGVHFVSRNFLGGRERADLVRTNRDVLVWCRDEAGLRIHGTTQEQPLVRFEEIERATLIPLPASPYDLAVTKQSRLHRDCYVVFEKSYYSAPFRLIGQEVLVRAGRNTVRIFNMQHELVATHDRAKKPGERMTHPNHLPPHKLRGLTQTRESCRERAAGIGPATAQVVEEMLGDPVLDKLPTVGRLLHLGERHTDPRLEAACRRAVCFDDARYETIKGILTKNLESEPLPEPVSAPPATTFARSGEELFGHLVGGTPWI